MISCEKGGEIMERVLVLTREFRGVPMGFGTEFERKGCICKTIISDVYCSKWNIIYRLKNRFGLSNDKYMDKKDAKFAEYIYKVCEEFNPNIIYVCHGTQLRADVVDKLKKRYLMVVDLIDRLEFFPALYDCVSHYDLVYTYIEADCNYLTEKGVNCKYLPAIGNKECFFPMNINKDIDICFVGATYPSKFYGDRLEIINRLIEDFPQYKIFVGGECAPIRRPEKFLKWAVNKKKREIFNNKNITSDECNVIYNRSKICLNINRINTGEGWSERLGNIMFTGSLQIVTYNQEIEKNFGDHILTFKNYDELRKLVKLYLDDDDLREAKARSCYSYYLHKVDEMNKQLNLVDDVLSNMKMKVYGI